MSERVLQQNINTKQLWDSMYTSEAELAQDRLFGPRLDQVMRWVKLRGAEVSPLGRLSFLDIGCGLGDLAKRVLPEIPDCQPAGVDISAVAVYHARKKFPCGRFEVSDASKVPFEDGSFDLVWCGELLEHVNDPEAVVLEAGRVTRPGGLIVLSTPYKNRIAGPEHVWSHSTDDMMRWKAMVGRELLFFSYDVLDDRISTMMFMAVRK